MISFSVFLHIMRKSRDGSLHLIELEFQWKQKVIAFTNRLQIIFEF